MAGTPSPAQLADSLVRTYGEKTVGSRSALIRRLTPVGGPDRVAAFRLLYAATGGNPDLTERLLPLSGILAKDLRGLPVVVPAGALYVSPSGTRASTGTHYTPRELADEVAGGALEDVVYCPGPAQTSNRNMWKVRPSRELLALRVADIAVGSGAFLVAACRYLAERLVEAWAAEGDREARKLIDAIRRDGPADDVEADALTIRARRVVIQHCLYGVDVNPMAVEIAKLSLWLISLDRTKPFTFLDHRLVAGDSLLGITSLAQLEELHLDPAAGRALSDRWLGDPGRGVRELIAAAARARRQLADRADDSLHDVQRKSELWQETQRNTADERLIADLLVGATLAAAGRPDRQLNEHLRDVADLARRITAGSPGAVAEARALANQWLASNLAEGETPRLPLHWPVVFADVFEEGGFDAVVGNQPYLGGRKITGAFGERYRESLVQWIGNGSRGSADLVAYFVLRSHELLHDKGVAGLIATNTLAQGDTREVGLARLLAQGVTIRRATKSRRWPTTSATLEVCLVKTARCRPGEHAVQELDRVPVHAITASLDPASRVRGAPSRLAANAEVSFIGLYVLGMGFTMGPEQARELISQDARNAEVLFPYLNGQDLNSRPDCSASRWVINFHDWTLERASSYSACFRQVEKLVKPERSTNNRRQYRTWWWHYAEKRPELTRRIAEMDRVVAITRVSKAVMPTLVPSGQVISERIVVFASDDTGLLAMLSSAVHYWWFISNMTTHGAAADPQYSPSRNFETLPLPMVSQDLRRLGDRLDLYRRDLMLARQAGLTATYNLVHGATCTDEDIAELRRIHVAIDEEVVRAYGWDDLVLDHDFYETRQGIRYTVGSVVRQEILDRLLELNHTRYAEERRIAANSTPRQLELDDDDSAA
jgi:hypothetical protein